MFKCLNCGFIFKTPKIEWRRNPTIRPNVAYSIDPRALYYPLQVCPRCGSDAIEEVRK